MKQNFQVLYSDEDIVVVDKPPHVFVHPAPGHEKGTLSEALCKMFPQMRGVGSIERSGVVHRLDAQTSGVMIFALNETAYLKLRHDFESHKNIEKKYLAVLHGAPKPASGMLKAAIGRKSWDSKRMAIDGLDAKRSITYWQVLGKNGNLALVEFRIKTGRMHQIRVVAAHLGHPIAGDALYGDPKRDARMRIKPARVLLHAVEISFDHPRTDERMTFAAEPPADIIYAL